ncbi:unnamed protein product [Phaedon cochleariae]|uniref:CIDE-N domain-containing protein n=1 Tax=Phaedon cochleariae TaxID=80249 RepID=A0A9N9SK36_PHACE|nr:unnamed protein product [Phaedon cochleariae]
MRCVNTGAGAAAPVANSRIVISSLFDKSPIAIAIQKQRSPGLVLVMCINVNRPSTAMEEETDQSGKPFKITNSSRESRKGLVACSLEDLTSKVLEKLAIANENKITVVLEVDGTEIDDEEYFGTLDPHTSLMILTEGQNWSPPSPPCRINMDQVDDANGGTELAGLVGKLKHNLCHVSLLGGAELELLSDMDPESLVDITFPDKIFLEQLKEASGRFLCEKRQAQDALELLRLYREREAEGGN